MYNMLGAEGPGAALARTAPEQAFLDLHTLLMQGYIKKREKRKPLELSYLVGLKGRKIG